MIATDTQTPETTVVRGRGHERVAAIMGEMSSVEVPSTTPEVVAFKEQYRAAWGVTRFADDDYDEKWRAVLYRGRIVAGFGEKWGNRVLEVTGAYCEPSRYGRIAVYTMGLNYKAWLDKGTIDHLLCTILWDNLTMWKATLKEFKQSPQALVFDLHREGIV